MQLGNARRSVKLSHIQPTILLNFNFREDRSSNLCLNCTRWNRHARLSERMSHLMSRWCEGQWPRIPVLCHLSKSKGGAVHYHSSDLIITDSYKWCSGRFRQDVDDLFGTQWQSRWTEHDHVKHICCTLGTQECESMVVSQQTEQLAISQTNISTPTSSLTILQHTYSYSSY